MDRRVVVGWLLLVVAWLGFVVAAFVALAPEPGRVQSWAVWSFLVGVAVASVVPRVGRWLRRRG